MSTFDLRAWQSRHGYTYNSAAQALGIGRTTYYDYLKRPELPKWLVLACKAIDAGIEAHSQQSGECAACHKPFNLNSMLIKGQVLLCTKCHNRAI